MSTPDTCAKVVYPRCEKENLKWALGRFIRDHYAKIDSTPPSLEEGIGAIQRDFADLIIPKVIVRR